MEKRTGYTRKTGYGVAVWVLCFLLAAGNPPSFAQGTGPGLIPASLGRVQKTAGDPGQRQAILILDAHTSVEAQHHIALIIQHLVRTQGVRHVFEEGYEGPVPTDDYFAALDDEIRANAAAYLMDKLRLSGAEFAHITRDVDFELVGVDNIEAHMDALRAYREAAAVRSTVDEDLSMIRREIENWIQKYYPQELQAWLELRRKFRQEHLDMERFLRELQRVLSGFQPEPEDELRWYSRLEEMDSLNYFRKLLRPGSEKEIVNEEALNPAALMEEIDSLEEMLVDMLLKEPASRLIYQWHQLAGLLDELNQQKISPPRFEKLREQLELYKTGELAETLASRTNRQVFLLRRWERAIQRAIRFYDAALRRESSVEEALDRFLDESSEQAFILVYGGFHQRNLEAMFRERGMGYSVVVPSMTSFEEGRERQYDFLMQGREYFYETLPTGIETMAPPERFFERAVTGSPVRAMEELDLIGRAVRAVSHFSPAAVDRWLKDYATRPRSRMDEHSGPRQSTRNFKLIAPELQQRSRSEARSAFLQPLQSSILDQEMLSEMGTARRKQFPEVPENGTRRWRSVYGTDMRIPAETSRRAFGANYDPVPLVLDQVRASRESDLRALAEALGRKGWRRRARDLSETFKTRFQLIQHRENHAYVSGFFVSEPHGIRNYYRALNARTRAGRRVVPRVHRMIAAGRIIQPELSAKQSGAVFEINDSDSYEEAVLEARLASDQTGFGFRQLDSYEDYRLQEELLGLAPNELVTAFHKRPDILLFVVSDEGRAFDAFMDEARDDPGRVRDAMFQIGSILGALHREGLIANDPKTDNFVYDPDSSRVYRIDLEMTMHKSDYASEEEFYADAKMEYEFLEEEVKYLVGVGLEEFQQGYQQELQDLPPAEANRFPLPFPVETKAVSQDETDSFWLLSEMDRAFSQPDRGIVIGVEYADLVNSFSTEQREELFAFASWHPDRVQLHIYGTEDPSHEALAPFRQLRRERNNVSLTVDREPARVLQGMERHDDGETFFFHLSKEARPEDLRFFRDEPVRLFRYPRSEQRSGLVGAMLLWQQYEAQGRVPPGFRQDADHFIYAGDALYDLATAYQSWFVIRSAA